MKILDKSRNILDETNKYTLLDSDITDQDGVMAEHFILNGSKELHYALMKQDNKYFFFDIRKNPTELKMLTDDGKFICPYCLNELSPCNGYIKQNGVSVEPYLRHINSSDIKVKSCIFNKGNPNWEKNISDYFNGESVAHKALKQYIFSLAKDGLLKKQNGYSIYKG